MSFDAGVAASLNQIAVLRANDDAAPARGIQRLNKVQGAELNATHRRGGFHKDDRVAFSRLHLGATQTVSFRIGSVWAWGQYHLR